MRRKPVSIKAEIFLALRHGEVVGMRGFYGSRWRAGESTTPHDVLVADDLVVRDGHRNRGVVHQLMQAAFDELSAAGEEFVFNLSGSPLTVLSSFGDGLAKCWRARADRASVDRHAAACSHEADTRGLNAAAPIFEFADLCSRRQRKPVCALRSPHR